MLALAVFVGFVLLLAVLGRGTGALEVLIWLVVLVVTEIFVIRGRRRNPEQTAAR